MVRGLAEAKVLKRVQIPTSGLFPLPDPQIPGADLSPAQKAAANAIIEKVRKQSFEVFLLDGVTGSGKTEVYFEAIAETLRQGKQALVLLPEIALSTQWLNRFEERFGVLPCPVAFRIVTGQPKTNLERYN